MVKVATNKKQINIRLQPSEHEKLKIIAKSDNRNITKLVEYWVKQNIDKYENEHGKIVPMIQQNNNGNGNMIANAEIKM